jgi:homoserine/homoserine lactone efflux protein
MEIENWLLFSSIALAATVTPGPAVLLVATHSISYSPIRAIFTILGNISGLFIMSLLSVLGLGALVLCSTTTFTLIKGIGACYLIYLGVKLWRGGFGQVSVSGNTDTLKKDTNLRLYIQGLMVALTNPKAIAFTTALFPQFINHSAPLIPQFVILVTTFMSYSFICLFFYAKMSAGASVRARSTRLEKIISRVFGTLFICSGIGLGASS